MTRFRLAALTVAAAAMAALPATSMAQGGADDPAGHQSISHTRADDSGNHTGQTGKKAKKNRVRVAGACTAGSTSKITLKRRDGRIEAEFEVDQNRVGITWQTTLSVNGTVVKTKSAVTKAPSGSFEVKKRVTDGAGQETVKGVATSPSGETCTATATI